MNTLSRCTLSVGAAAAFLAGCGGSQPPLSAPATSAQAWRAERVAHHPPTRASFQVLHRFGHAKQGHNFGGAIPVGGLIDVDGTLYGETAKGGRGYNPNGGFGLVYSISTTGAKKVLYRFRGAKHHDGAYPSGDLIDVNGTLYGTTRGGGKGCRGGGGTVYSITTDGTEKVLHNFCGASSYPNGGVVNVNGTLYGTTGGFKSGIVYSISTYGAYKVLYTFNGCLDGCEPTGELLNVNGTLYGVTEVGGTGCPTLTNGCGTVYSLTTSGKESVLYSFQGHSDGCLPESGLIDLNGTLYGTTLTGGGTVPCQVDYGLGTVYSVTTSGSENVLYRFKGFSDGAYPVGSLTAMNGNLYGTTTEGGSGHVGTIFSITTSGDERVVHSFSGSDGADPPGDLIDVNNILYGTTASGGFKSGCQNNGYGKFGCGTVFALTP